MTKVMLKTIPFLLIGQSNMFGADAIAPEPWEYHLSDERSTFHRMNALELIDDTELAPTPCQCGANRKIHGPEIGFARTLQRFMPGKYVIAKYTNNIPLEEPNYLWSVGQSYMNQALELFTSAAAAAGIHPIPKAILIAQGIDEALSPVRWMHFRPNFRGMINDLRAYFDSPLLRVIVAGSIHSPFPVHAQMKHIRDVQWEAAGQWLDDPLPNVKLVIADDLLPYVNGHHLTSSSQMIFGERFAMQAIAL